jgi:hypothetical protein
MEKIGLMAALLKYFGKKPGQSNTEFMAEMRALTDKDKSDLTEMLKTVGYDCTI